MSITALVCKIAVGAGSLTLAPGIVESPRYEGAEIRIELEDGQLRDITVNGPYDHAYSYAANGFRLTAQRSGAGWLLEARLGGADGFDTIRESLALTDMGRLIWVQFATSEQLHSSAGSVFSGHCDAQ
jgi:hypothetical protein